MASVADADTSAACFLFTDAAQAQLAAAFNAPDCPAAVLVRTEEITRPNDYDLSPGLLGIEVTLSPDRETSRGGQAREASHPAGGVFPALAGWSRRTLRVGVDEQVLPVLAGVAPWAVGEQHVRRVLPALAGWSSTG
jgi:hypothetical protein